jgi:hypothetical protein
MANEPVRHGANQTSHGSTGMKPVVVWDTADETTTLPG